jgi:hypothetical protein
MIEDTDQLNETFAAHEHLAPDAAEVLARAHGIARSYHRRRWAVRATGGAVLSAGIVAGSIALPGSLGHSSSTKTVSSITPAGQVSPSAAPTYTQAQELAAFFAAGYDYTDAQQLATLWNETGSINSVKADAGLKLLEGQPLPVQPSGTPESPVNKDVSAFFAAGYTYDDAVSLSKLWHNSSYQAKVEGGKKLLADEPLPIQPSGPKDPAAGSDTVVSSGAKGSAEAKARALSIQSKLLQAKGQVAVVPSGQSDDGESPALDKYFASGYDYNDAVKLGQLWNQSDINQIKTEAGQKLLDGQTLPIQPSEPPAEVISAKTTAEVNAFFNAGYTYNDAVKLGQLWNEDSWHAKADGGKKLMDGQTLPIAP